MNPAAKVNKKPGEGALGKNAKNERVVPDDDDDEEEEEEDNDDDDDDDDEEADDSEEADSDEDDDNEEEEEEPVGTKSDKSRETKKVAVSEKAAENDAANAQIEKITKRLLSGIPGSNPASTRKANQVNVKVMADDTNTKIKMFTDSSSLVNREYYPVSAQKFSDFESILFDVMGVTNVPLKLDDTSSSELSTLQELDDSKTTGSSFFISNMMQINKEINRNVLFHNRLNRLSIVADPDAEAEGKLESVIVRPHKDPHRTKIITIVLHNNKGVKPRKAGRILINKRNTSSLDLIISEISNLFKIDVLNIKKLFSLTGIPITDSKELYEFDGIFFASSTDKMHSRDLELDPQEINQVFANEFMKLNPNLKAYRLVESKLDRKSSSRLKYIVDQSKLEKKNDGNEDEAYPEELLNNYEIGEVIGQGTYGVVRECKDINTGIRFALKAIDLKKCVGKESMIENEISILRRVKHPNIVKLVEDYKSKECIFMIMEYLRAGDLLEAITENTKYGEKEAAKMVHNLASAISYLHSLKIVHRDIKLENILIHESTSGAKTLKLGDFGLAIKLEEPLTQKCGSPIYVAPEILLGKSYGLEVDVWSLGVIAYILLCGFAPFQGDTDEETYAIIKSSELIFVDPFWSDISADAKELIRKMLDRDQETRIKASDILADKWLKRQLSDEKESHAGAGKQSLGLDESLVATYRNLDTDRSEKSSHRAKTLEEALKKTTNYKASNILLNK